ncbi:hypothetical protein BDE02_03G191400, partial [Populus trichocarpa]
MESGIDRLIQSVKEELQISYAFSDRCCIYKVPERLRELNEKAYTPRLVSIGPIHHCNDKLKAMEDHKRMYLQEFIARTKEKETRLRNCYEETNWFSSENFIKMILMDAVFVIMFLLKYNCRKSTEFRGSRDSIFYPPYKWFDVRVDICLLENQLPFFILEELCGLSTILGNSPKPTLCWNIANYVAAIVKEDGCHSPLSNDHEHHRSAWGAGIPNTLIELTHGFFSNEWGSWAVGEYWGKIDFSEVKHLVDFLTIYHRPTEQQQHEELEVLTAPSVKELHQAGVKFVLSPSKNLLDIKFDRNKGRLEFPRLQLEDGTEIIIRNMQAFEQCHGMEYSYVGDYICLMGLFLGASKDVEILVENRIIDNWLLSKEEVVKLFHSLNIENLVSPDGFFFEGLIKDLNAFRERPWNKRKANLKQNYFNTPWAAVSVSGAVILLILTVIQSVCPILEV